MNIVARALAAFMRYTALFCFVMGMALFFPVLWLFQAIVYFLPDDDSE
jgi:hypothetical protein